jgi:hypothetical protein
MPSLVGSRHGRLVLHGPIGSSEKWMVRPSLGEGDDGLVIGVFASSPGKDSLKGTVISSEMLAEHRGADFSNRTANITSIISDVEHSEAGFEEKLTSREYTGDELKDV